MLFTDLSSKRVVSALRKAGFLDFENIREKAYRND